MEEDPPELATSSNHALPDLEAPPRPGTAAATSSSASSNHIHTGTDEDLRNEEVTTTRRERQQEDSFRKMEATPVVVTKVQATHGGSSITATLADAPDPESQQEIFSSRIRSADSQEDLEESSFYNSELPTRAPSEGRRSSPADSGGSGENANRSQEASASSATTDNNTRKDPDDYVARRYARKELEKEAAKLSFDAYTARRCGREELEKEFRKNNLEPPQSVAPIEIEMVEVTVVDPGETPTPTNAVVDPEGPTDQVVVQAVQLICGFSIKQLLMIFGLILVVAAVSLGAPNINSGRAFSAGRRSPVSLDQIRRRGVLRCGVWEQSRQFAKMVRAYDSEEDQVDYLLVSKPITVIACREK